MSALTENQREGYKARTFPNSTRKRTFVRVVRSQIYIHAYTCQMDSPIPCSELQNSLKRLVHYYNELALYSYPGKSKRCWR